jgi:Asp-tRNA(Asn)/Glu-tRNA(Gln) amidotransferase A subunit family amidase
MNLNQMSLHSAADGIASRRFGSEELVRDCLDRIAAREDKVRAFAHCDPEAAIAAARRADQGGSARGPLHGVPIAIKDNIDTQDMPTEYNSAIYPGHRPSRDAACVAKLRDAGAVILGKTKTSEFAHLTPADTANPHDVSRTPGGSSSGSAAAVADFMVPAALGTQTGGSTIRPASYCGVYGYKPSYRRIDTRGVKSLSVSFDTVGIIARAIDDIVLLDRVLAPSQDPVASPARPLRIAYCETPFWTETKPETRAALSQAAHALASHGLVVEPLSLSPEFTAINAGFFTLVAVEASWSLAAELANHPELLSAQFRDFVEMGRAVDPDVVQQMRAGLLSCALEIDRAFESFDVILTPAAPGEPDPGNGLGNNEFNRIWTMLQVPCLTIPGFVGPNGMPVGIQLVARRGADRLLLEHGRAVAEIVYDDRAHRWPCN